MFKGPATSKHRWFHHRYSTISSRLSKSATWPDQLDHPLPMVLLGIHTALKEDIHCTVAELAYGTTLCLHRQFFSCIFLWHQPCYICTVPQVYHAAASCCTCPSHHPVHITSSLITCTYVFVWHDTIHKPLQHPYDGPYKVIKRALKHLTLDIQGRSTTVSLDRLKPTHVEPHTSASTMPPPSNMPPNPQQSTV